MITIDGNGAVASVAFRTSEVIAIYPITPSSTMAGFWPLRPRSLYADPCAGERVMESEREPARLEVGV